jgi:hypothetical protein
MRQGLYNLENTLKQSTAAQEGKKEKEKDTRTLLATPQPREALTTPHPPINLAPKGLKKTILQRKLDLLAIPQV